MYVVRDGFRRAPRGLATLDGGPVTITLTDIRRAVPTDIGRKLNMRIGAAETVQLLAGLSDAVQLNQASNGRFEQFTNGGLLRGAYGPRTFQQISRAISKLSRDSDSRQAWVNIWRSDELENSYSDVPCTIALGFSVVDDKLQMNVVMRSSDLWLGIPYDFMMFTRLQSLVAWAIGVDPGSYIHQTMSLHLYERDLTKLEQLHPPTQLTEIPLWSPGFGTKPGERSAELAHTRWSRATAWAKACVINSGHRNKLPAYARWYFDQLKDTRSDNLLCSVCRYVKPIGDFFECHLPRQCQGICKDCAKSRASERRRTLDTRLKMYGLTREDFTELLGRQNNVCAICKQVPDSGPTKDFVIDHDHNTGKVRGLLCNKCNNGLGLLGDDITGVLSALQYLEMSENEA